MDLALQNRIELGSTPEPNTGCWLWTGSVVTAGYGAISVFRKNTSAHRASYVAFVGEIPTGKLVRHKCDTKLCVNPEHLTLGTHSDNAYDRSERGRVDSTPIDSRRSMGAKGASIGSWGMGLDLKERLDRLSMFEPNTACQLWLGTVVKSTGYGEIKVDGRKTSAHRAMWLSHHGEIPAGMVVMHKCDVRICVNLDHLSIGSRKENSADMSRKGRGIFNRLTREQRIERSRLAMETMGPDGLKARAAARVSNTTSEQRSVAALKAAETRRSKPGYEAPRQASPALSDKAKRIWAKRTIEQRREHGRKLKEGREKAQAMRSSRLIRINLLSPVPQ